MSSAAVQCEAAPLFVPFDESSACVWLPPGEREEIDLDPFASVLEPFTGGYVAVSAEAVARVNAPHATSERAKQEA